MARKLSSHASKRFLNTSYRRPKREVFVEGDWVNIKENLKLSGWDYSQQELIHFYLRSGIPLSFAIKQLTNNIGFCPIRSRSFFNY